MWGLNPKLGSPALSTRARKEPRYQPTVKSIRGSVGQGETAGEAESLLKGQSTKFHLQPLTLSAGKGRAEWTRDASGESGVRGSGDRTEGKTIMIHVLSHSPKYMSHPSQAEHFSLNVISLRGSNSPPTGIISPHPVVLKTDCL